jgi:hypothetical protein
MAAFDFVLRDAGPIAGNSVRIEHRGMTSVAGHNGAERAIGAVNREHRYIVIDRTHERLRGTQLRNFSFGIVAAIDGERCDARRAGKA